VIGREASFTIENEEEKHINEKSVFLVLGWSKKRWEIGRICGVEPANTFWYSHLIKRME
jgi:hypothetical protein